MAYISVDESMRKSKKYINNNFTKSKKLINFCINNNIENFIFSSTAAVYKYGLKKNNEKSKIQPSNPYGESKYLTEKYIGKMKGLTKFCILRYFNVAGASKNLLNGQNSKKKASHLIKKIIETILSSKTFYINGNDYDTKDGTAVRDFIHIQDLSDIHLKILNYLKIRPSSSTTIFNCGYGKGSIRCCKNLKITHFTY